MLKRTVLSLLTAATLIPQALAWGAAGHEIVATIAQIHLHPSVYPALCSILNFTSPNPAEPPCHLAPVAAWADQIRNRMRWSSHLHYIGGLDDHPSQTCAFPGAKGWEGKSGDHVLGAIRNVTTVLQDSLSVNALDDGRANEAMKFLIHFMGDLHMPLHLTGRDRGGNSVKVHFGTRVTNLHSLWDGLLIAKALRNVPRNYSRPLPSRQIESSLRGAIYDSYVRRIMWEGVLGKWKNEVSSWLSCPASDSPAATTPATTTPDSFWTPIFTLYSYLRSAFTSTGKWGGPSETDDDILCPYSWAKPIHALNCEIVWPKALDEPPYSHPQFQQEEEFVLEGDEGFAPRKPSPYLELDTPEYSGVIADQWILEKLMAQAGIRLAALINYLLAEEGGGALTIARF